MSHSGLMHLSRLYGSFGPLINFLSIVFGLVTCFLGYRIFKLYLGLIGFIFGYLFGSIMGGYVAGGGVIGPVVGGLLFGIVVGGIAFGLYIVGVFLMGAMFTAATTALVLSTFGIRHEFLILLIAGVIGGLVAARLQRFFIILSTAFSGAWTAVFGIASVFFKKTMSSAVAFPPVGGKVGVSILLAALVLGVAGMAAQFFWFPDVDSKRRG